jgi:hypothetical protein
MLMLPILDDSTRAHRNFPKFSFTSDERRQLNCVKATVAAERQLLPPNQPCPDHQACRRLAFALWLFATGRLSDAVDR